MPGVNGRAGSLMAQVRFWLATILDGNFVLDGNLVVVSDRFSSVELPPLPPGQRVVLGLLALAGGAPVTRDAIIDALWDDDPPRTAITIVQTYVSRLRSLLHDGTREYLPESDGAGYRLAATPDALDPLTFRRLVEQARTAVDEHAACGRSSRRWRCGAGSR